MMKKNNDKQLAMKQLSDGELKEVVGGRKRRTNKLAYSAGQGISRGIKLFNMLAPVISRFVE